MTTHGVLCDRDSEEATKHGASKRRHSIQIGTTCIVLGIIIPVAESKMRWKADEMDSPGGVCWMRETLIQFATHKNRYAKHLFGCDLLADNIRSLSDKWVRQPQVKPVCGRYCHVCQVCQSLPHKAPVMYWEIHIWFLGDYTMPEQSL